VVLPPGTELNAITAKVGDLWQGWGWQVLERDSFTKPN
jgi:hypothetical protein